MKNKNKEKFGENLRELRENRYKSGKKLAKILNMPPTTYYSYEQGEAFPDLDVLINISGKLEISLDELFRPFLINEKKIFTDLLSDLKKIKASKNPDHWHVVNVIIQMAIQIMEDEKRGGNSILSQSTK